MSQRLTEVFRARANPHRHVGLLQAEQEVRVAAQTV
jgi:hypothetical protein